MLCTLCLLSGLALISMPLVAGLSRSDDLSPSELESARGGNPDRGKASKRCDMESGVYVGCTVEAGFCRQCLTEQEDGSLEGTMADRPDPDTPPDNETGYMEGMSSQNCGNYFVGMCELSNTSPTGFVCEAQDSMSPCTEGIFNVVPQPDM